MRTAQRNRMPGLTEEPDHRTRLSMIEHTAVDGLLLAAEALERPELEDTARRDFGDELVDRRAHELRLEGRLSPLVWNEPSPLTDADFER